MNTNQNLRAQNNALKSSIINYIKANNASKNAARTRLINSINKVINAARNNFNGNRPPNNRSQNGGGVTGPPNNRSQNGGGVTGPPPNNGNRGGGGNNRPLNGGGVTGPPPKNGNKAMNMSQSGL